MGFWKKVFTPMSIRAQVILAAIILATYVGELATGYLRHHMHFIGQQLMPGMVGASLAVPSFRVRRKSLTILEG